MKKISLIFSFCSICYRHTNIFRRCFSFRQNFSESSIVENKTKQSFWERMVMHCLMVGLLTMIGKVGNGQPPTISLFTPASGVVGTSVTISGTNFNATPANNIVYFGAVRASVTSGSTTSLNVIAPAGATYQPISVLNTATGLTGYSSKPFITTFTNPFGTGISASFYSPKLDFAVSPGAGPRSISMADMNGDGKPDIVYTNEASAVIAVRQNTSNLGGLNASSLGAPVQFTTGSIAISSAVCDLDGDGKLRHACSLLFIRGHIHIPEYPLYRKH